MQKKKQKKGEANSCEEVGSFKKPTTCWWLLPQDHFIKQKSFKT